MIWHEQPIYLRKSAVIPNVTFEWKDIGDKSGVSINCVLNDWIERSLLVDLTMNTVKSHAIGNWICDDLPRF